MKKVITYGTFDLFHEGHYRLLQRAKELGDYLHRIRNVSCRYWYMSIDSKCTIASYVNSAVQLSLLIFSKSYCCLDYVKKAG